MNYGARHLGQRAFGLAPRIIFLGAPGVGKGTYASRIAPKLGIPTISTGDLVREEIRNGTSLGKEIKAYNDAGDLVPDRVITNMLQNRLEKDDAKNGYILDGFPRTVPSAVMLEEFARPSVVLNITMPGWALTEKLLGRRMCGDCGQGYNVAFVNQGEYYMPPLLPEGGADADCHVCDGPLVARADDTEEVVAHRMSVYEDQTSPLVNHYDSQGLLVSFEVKRGLDDLSKLTQVLGRALHDAGSTKAHDRLFAS